MSNLFKGAPAMAGASRIEPRDSCRKPFRFYLFVILTGLLIFARPLPAFALEVASPTSYPGFDIGGHGIYGVRTPLDACYYWNGQYGWTFRMTGEINVLSPTSWNCPRTRDGMTYDTYVGLATPAVCPVTSGGLPYVWNYKTGYCERSLTCNTGYKLDAAGTSCIPDVACPANMSGSPCACNPGGYVPNPNGAGCVLEQYILSALQEPLPDVEPGSSASPYVEVVNALTRQPKEGAVVNIRVNVDDSSGGHDHGSTGGALRPKGTLGGCKAGGVPGTVDCTTGPDGRVSFTFGAPDVSGTHTFTATCISHACSGSKTGAIKVKVNGLVPIPASQFYTFIGATDNHSGNHYLTPEAATVLRRMAASYQIEDKFWQLKQARKRGQYTYTPSMLYVNDASLIWGGRFDTKGNWATPHAMHRRGVVIDVRANSNTGAIPLASFANFKKMAASYGGADAQVHCTSNKTDGQNRQPPSCIGRDGSQDSNRHMHILLLGVDQ